MKILFTVSFFLIVISQKAQAQDTTRNHQDSLDKITFTKGEIVAMFPGGVGAWKRFLAKSLSYPDAAYNDHIEGTVWVQFIVDRQGNVSDVRTFGGATQGGMGEEAVRLIKKSGKWAPAVQNGRQVRSYKKVPIDFKL